MVIAVCDDEEIFIEELSAVLKEEFAKHNEEIEILTYDNGYDLIEACRRKNIDAIFLDIIMPDMDGFETAKKIRSIKKSVMLVFISNSTNSVFVSYEYMPIWFILKSQMYMLEMAVKALLEKARMIKESNSVLQIKIANFSVEIDVKEVKYFKTDGHYVRYIKYTGEESESYRAKLDDVAAQLESINFIKCHKRFLVNLKAAKMIDRGELVLFDDERIPISRTKIKYVKERFHKYFRLII